MGLGKWGCTSFFIALCSIALADACIFFTIGGLQQFLSRVTYWCHFFPESIFLLCLSLVILTEFQIFYYYQICYGDLWCYYCKDYSSQKARGRSAFFSNDVSSIQVYLLEHQGFRCWWKSPRASAEGRTGRGSVRVGTAGGGHGNHFSISACGDLYGWRSLAGYSS